MLYTRLPNLISRPAIPKWGSADPWGSAKGLEGVRGKFCMAKKFEMQKFGSMYCTCNRCSFLQLNSILLETCRQQH